VDPTEVTKFEKWLNSTYGVTVAEHRGKVHNYLGMILDFSKDGHVMVNMTEYIHTIIAEFPEKITGIRTTPAADHLFRVREETEACPLPEEQAREFHHAVAQLLFSSSQSRHS
jgi:hypothetical protein